MISVVCALGEDYLLKGIAKRIAVQRIGRHATLKLNVSYRPIDRPSDRMVFLGYYFSDPFKL
jgi:hypothetical protein